MRYLKRIIYTLFFAALTINGAKCIAQNKTKNSTGYYIGTNPLAIPLGFSIKEENKRFLPILAGNEYGANVVGGYFFRSNQSLEGRISLSNIHQVAFVGQIHLGTNYFFQKNKTNIDDNGWHLGGYTKYWDFYNRQTKVHFHNICPYFTVGYTFNAKRLLFDFRINQTVAVLSWSSLEHTRGNIAWMLSPWPEFIPVLPTISITINYKLL